MTLRIRRTVARQRVVYTLTGRIQADRLADLETLVKSERPGSEIALDLKDVKLVDREAVRFLGQVEADGTELINCAGYIRAWISQEANGSEPRTHGESNGPGE